MGRSYPIHYIVRIHTTMPNVIHTPVEWRSRPRFGLPADGKPTTANLDKWVTAFEDSCRPGKPNAHLGTFSVTYAEIYDQKLRVVVAIWERSKQRKNEPMFQVIG